MSKMWIVLGDITSSGGKVITGSPFTDIDGKAVARITDKATCPSHKGVFPIVDGDSTIIIDGQPVALHGSKLACGCAVLSVTQLSVFVDQGGGDHPQRSRTTHAPAVQIAPAAKTPRPTLGPENPERVDSAATFGLRYQAMNPETNEPIAGCPYIVSFTDGRRIEGTTDDSGFTQQLQSSEPDNVTVHFCFMAPSGVLIPKEDLT